MTQKPKIISTFSIDKLPKNSGVYLFYEGNPSASSGRDKLVYIGKAINIRDRVKNHFQQPSYRDNLFIESVSNIGFIETNSEIEALILEAHLIKKHQPKFNVVWRDDKNYFYVAIGNYRGTSRKLTQNNAESLPYVYITHQPKLIPNTKHPTPNYVGPFVEGSAIKKTLKFLRKVFPYYTSKTHPKQKCTWCHLDLCPGPNPDTQGYKKNIKKLTLILQGKRKNVLNSLKKEMKSFSHSREYENAKKIRDKIYALENIMSHAKIIGMSDTPMTFDSKWHQTETALRELLNMEGKIERIECYDISNIQGKSATGSMVVFMNGNPDKSQYKKFRIKMKNEPNDIAMLKEVLTRRLLHPEWDYPEIMLIDGGIAQLNVAIKTKNENTLFLKRFKKRVLLLQKIKIISIAKGRQELFIEGNPPSLKASEGQRNKPIPLKNLPQDIYNLIKHLDDEAHRFAISYHKKLRRKSLLDI